MPPWPLRWQRPDPKIASQHLWPLPDSVRTWEVHEVPAQDLSSPPTHSHGLHHMLLHFKHLNLLLKLYKPTCEFILESISTHEPPNNVVFLIYFVFYTKSTWSNLNCKGKSVLFELAGLPPLSTLSTKPGKMGKSECNPAVKRKHQGTQGIHQN